MNQVEALEKEIDYNYNEGLGHFYRCIIAVLERQHLGLKVDEMAAGIIEYMSEQEAKRDEE